MSITLNNNDFQCLQDQLVDLKTKNYELAEKNRRSQADFEAAKAKICILQLKLEEQERDFQVTSATLRREIEAVSTSTTDAKQQDSAKENRDEEYKAKYKKLLTKAKEIQQRYDKSVEVVQQLDNQNKVLTEKVRKLEEESTVKQKQIEAFETDFQSKVKDLIEKEKNIYDEEREKYIAELKSSAEERDNLKKELDRLTAEVNNFDHRLESEAEERKIHERKGLQIVKELKRQLALEKNRTETLQKRLENLLSDPQITSNGTEIDSSQRTQLSTSSSTYGNSSSNGNGSRTNQDSNSVGSWSFVPVKADGSNQNETLSLCSMNSADRETVQQQPCDITKSTVPADDEELPTTSADEIAKLVSSEICEGEKGVNEEDNFENSTLALNDDEAKIKALNLFTPTYNPTSDKNSADSTLIEEQAVLVDRLTRLQHDKWMLEEKLAYMEQANFSLSEDLANKSEIIKQYFINQALKTSSSNPTERSSSLVGSFLHNNNNGPNSRRTSFPNNVNQLLAEKPSIKKVVDFLKERSQVSGGEPENISREATKKMQVMLEETLTKCLKLQENLDFVTSELNKLKS